MSRLPPLGEPVIDTGQPRQQMRHHQPEAGRRLPTAGCGPLRRRPGGRALRRGPTAAPRLHGRPAAGTLRAGPARRLGSAAGAPPGRCAAAGPAFCHCGAAGPLPGHRGPEGAAVIPQ